MVSFSKIITLLLLIQSCSSPAPVARRDWKEKSRKAPDFLRTSIPDNSKVTHRSYFERLNGGVRYYESRYELDGVVTTRLYSTVGKFVEQNQHIRFTELSELQQIRIRAYLSQRYPDYSIRRTERRIIAEGDHFIDVEINWMKARTGTLEVSFTLDGKFVRAEDVAVQALDELI